MIIRVTKEGAKHLSPITCTSQHWREDGSSFKIYWSRKKDEDEFEIDEFLIPHTFVVDLRGDDKLFLFRLNGTGRVYRANSQLLLKDDVEITLAGGLMDPSYPSQLRVNATIIFPKGTHISELIKVCLRLEAERGFSVFRPR